MTQQPRRPSKSRGLNVWPNCIPASAATAMNSFRRARHSTTADTDPKTRPSHSTHGQSRSRLFSNVFTGATQIGTELHQGKLQIGKSAVGLAFVTQLGFRAAGYGEIAAPPEIGIVPG